MFITKGAVILQALEKRNRLKEICRDFNINYKTCLAVSEGKKEPPFTLMEKFLYLIPCEFWFEEPTAEFAEKMKNGKKNAANPAK